MVIFLITPQAYFCEVNTHHMSIRLQLLLCLILCLSAGCASEGSKFIGHWIPVKPLGYPQKSLLVIQKRGKVFDSYNTAVPGRSTRFSYDKEHDCLRERMGEKAMNRIYLDSIGHLKVVPEKWRKTDHTVLVFEKAAER